MPLHEVYVPVGTVRESALVCICCLHARVYLCRRSTIANSFLSKEIRYLDLSLSRLIYVILGQKSSLSFFQYVNLSDTISIQRRYTFLTWNQKHLTGTGKVAATVRSVCHVSFPWFPSLCIHGCLLPAASASLQYRNPSFIKSPEL